MLNFFALTLFVSATLLFWIQPMFTKMVLPLLGGSPAVWNTAMMFFQAALLLGYAYAHLSAKVLGVRRQPILSCTWAFCWWPSLSSRSPWGKAGRRPRRGTRSRG